MIQWWNGLTVLNQVFFGVAGFFTLIFLYQAIMTLIGLAGSGGDAEMGEGDFAVDADAADADLDVAADAGEVDAEAAADQVTGTSFRLFSFRSIVAFGMMFGWAGGLYMHEGTPAGRAIIYALLWAAAGALVVSLLLYLMRRMTETGTPVLASCVGRPATVYMNIPAKGAGQVRTVVSGAVSHVPARSAGGKALEAGTPVRVRRLLDPHTVEVERLDA